MPNRAKIEDIEEMRRLAGIDDVDLRLAIRGLKPGDLVQLTLSSESRNNQNALVRITQIRGSAYRGKLVKKIAGSQAGELVKFTTAHIHSVMKKADSPADSRHRSPIATPKKAKPASSQPLTMEERLHRIENMGKRIEGYIAFICRIATQNGTSNEGKEKGVQAFYERMILVEEQLGKIHDELRLE